MKNFLSILGGSLAVLISAANGVPLLGSRQDLGSYCGELSSEQQGDNIDGAAGNNTHLMITKDKCHPMILCAPGLVNNVRHVKVYSQCACYLWTNPTCGSTAEGVGVNLDVDLPKNLDKQVGSYWCKPAPNDTIPVSILSDASTTDLTCKLDHPDRKPLSETSASEVEKRVAAPESLVDTPELSARNATCNYVAADHDGKGTLLFLDTEDVCHVLPPELDDRVSSFKLCPGCECAFWTEPKCSGKPAISGYGGDLHNLAGALDDSISAYFCRCAQPLPPVKRVESQDLTSRADTCGFFTTEHGGQGNSGFMYKDEQCHTFPPGFDNGVSSIHVSDNCECSFWLEHHCISWPDVRGSNAFKDLDGKFDKELSTYSCSGTGSNTKTGFFYGGDNVTSIEARDPCIECPCDGLDGPCHCVPNGCCCT
ncbi:uncharacterized protein BDZ99DRAFT_568691 [Mytilinidion resinicola]|uniref:Uncharacterized protein n=1 Tax=Mytilinidion resinicola TaxID=574789 RepID=A0A6A6YYJ0_9PEZI|nr:uncharacterized protein BDZ99DRAFT_568691 [Mytilinidion resinicola]KAF2813503.1 hypothetical protein BDZ99DRAFT_568691 [Mytilinidion resinicola]